MDIDLIFVVGCVIGAFAVPITVSAYSDRQTPRLGALLVLISGCMITYAATEREDPYRLDQLDDVFVSVLARYIN